MINNQFLKRLSLFMAVTGGYFLLGWSSLAQATLNNYTSPLWLPSGLGIGCLIIFGSWLAPAIFLGALLTNMTAGSDVYGLIGIASGNMLEAIIGAKLIGWILRRYNENAYVEFYAILLGGASAAAISASIGVSALYILDVVKTEDFIYTWYTWLSGDVTGMIILLPLFLENYLGKKEDRYSPMSKIFKAIFLTILLVSGLWFIFTQNLNQAICWIITPVFILAGLRFGQFLARIMLILVAFIVVFLTLKGFSPFDLGAKNLNFIHMQSLVASYAFGVLFIRPFATSFQISRKFIFGICLGWMLVFMVIYNVYRLENYFLMKDFAMTVDSAIVNLNDTVRRHELLLTSSESLFDIKPDLTKQDWEEHVNSLKLSTAFEGVKGVGYIAQVKKDDFPGWSKKMNQRGVHGLFIKTFDKSYSENFPDHYIITFMEPLKNLAAVGLDIGSEKIRRETANSALKEQDVFITGVIELITDDIKRQGFQILLPVITKNKSAGWVNIAVVSEIFFNEALSQYLRLLDTRILLNDELVFGKKNRPENMAYRKKFEIKKTLNLFNRNFVAHFYPTDGFFVSRVGNTGGLALILSLFMLFISAFLLEQVTYGQKSEKLVRERTEELEASKEQLVQASKMATLGRMVSSVAHEINNPLAIILMKIKVVSVMLDELKVKDSRVKNEIEKITSTTLRIENIVKGLKSFSRLSIDDPFIPLPFRAIVQESLDLSMEKFKINRVELRSGEIPEVSILTRHGQLSQVLLNLMDNSIDAIEGLDEKWIGLDFIQLNAKIQISVTDSGPKISHAILNKIMDPFYTTKRAGKGTGLGLSIAKGIVEDHGGNLWFDEHSERTRFVFEVPTFQTSGVS